MVRVVYPPDEPRPKVARPNIKLITDERRFRVLLDAFNGVFGGMKWLPSIASDAEASSPPDTP